MMRMSTHRARRRHTSHGQALVETALFFVFLVFLVIGLVDIGGLLDDHLSIEYGARQAARTASVLGNQSDADCAIVGSVTAALASLGNVSITQITIYKAGATGVRSSDGGIETVYPQGTTCSIISGVPTLSQAPSVNKYPPSQRKNTSFTEDSIGVEIAYNYTFALPFVPIANSAFASTDYAVMPVEPIGVASPIPSPTALPTPTP